MSVQLIIKSAAQSVDDFKLNCEMSWTIAQVKDQITATYPTKPAREHQKLIYGGKLLPDHLPLTSILNPTQELHIMHLVCPPKSEPSVSNSNKTKSVSPACTVPPLTPSGIYSQVLPDQQLPTPPVLTNVPTATMAAMTPNTPADAVHQYLAMQQMYTQFMTQYFSQYNMAPPYGPVPATTPSVQPPSPPAQQQQNNNNQNGAARPRERWDIIDLLYVCSRAVMMFALLIYYSSPPRVVAVCVLVLLLSLFAKINKERQQELQRAANEQQRRAAENTTTAPENEASTEPAENAEVRNETEPSEAPSVPPVPVSNLQRALSVPITILTIIVSFFTSLIPSEPLPVNAN